jgi:hypothetical protein
MKFNTRIAVLLGVLALLVTPTAALATGPEYAPEEPEVTLPGPSASLKEKTKAYGVYCKSFSKKKVKGSKQTPFSRCVTAMAKASTVKHTTPKKACTGFSKARVKGQKGTEYSRCVSSAAEAKAEALAEA